MPDIDTSPAALRALAAKAGLTEPADRMAAPFWAAAARDALRALAAEKESATVKPDLTVGAEVKPLKAVAVTGVRPPPAQEPSSTVHAPADLRTLAEAATPGPWQVDITRHPYSMVRLDGSFAEGEHVERWIQTVRIDPQAKAPYPIVVRSAGIAHPGEPPITMVHIRPEDADYLAAVSPEVVLALLDTIDSLRASLAAAEKERDAARWQPIETAPKDGTLVDLWAGERIADCAWNVPSNCWAERSVSSFSGRPYWAVVNNPTHWMPLPAAPTNPEDAPHA